MEDRREEEETLAWLTLALASGFGPVLVRELLREVPGAREVLALGTKGLVERGVPAEVARQPFLPRTEARAREALLLARRHGIAVVTQKDADYPRLLAETAAPPVVLFLRGTLSREEDALALVGTRRATPEGRRLARALARDVAAAEVTIVSGLARGIDAAAHEGALDAGGRTIAVLGSGHLALYPPEHAGLADRILAAKGAVVSELPPLAPARPWCFPRRNRIVSGLSLAVLVVEAGERSGALGTAKQAQDQDRDVLAVPGSPASAFSRGTNRLIRDGATLVESGEDVLFALGRCERRLRPKDAAREGAPAQVLAVLRARGGPVLVDALIEALARPPFEVLQALGKLDGEGAIVRRTDGRIELAVSPASA